MEKKSRKQSAIDHTFWDIDIQLIDKELQVPLEVEALKDSVTKIDWGTFFLSFFWSYLLHVHVKFNFFFEKSTKIRNKSPSSFVVYFVDF